MATAARRLAPEARRQQLVDVALALFAAEPYESVGLEDVAERANVRRGLLYRYFPGGKPDLHLAVVEEAWSRLVNILDTDPARPLQSKLPRNLAAYLDLAEREDPALLVLERARRVDEPRIQEVAYQARRAFARSIALNHLGTTDPPEPVLAALAGYLALGEVLMEEWTLRSTITRSQVETLLERALGPIIEIAGDL